MEVRDYAIGFNSSYCGDSSTKELMMTMLHQAYKAYVPPTAAPAGPPGAGPPIRVLSEVASPLSSTKKYYWQVAHVPNLTMGVLTDQGANEVRVIPRNTSCFTTPGFTFMVACMTAKPVYIGDRTHYLAPPPFNDRCLAVGGKCGATCGSAQAVDEDVASHCTKSKVMTRRLQDHVEASPYRSETISEEKLVWPIKPRMPATNPAIAARFLFTIFVVITLVSYITTILSKFPGNFRDNYPLYTWDEIRTHGYVLEKFGSAVTCSTSADDNKMVIFRNWLGKVTTRPQFDDSAFPTFSKWVDVFCDEGHREGARLLWMAWTDFLDTNPPGEFLQEWATQLRLVSSFDQTTERSPFDLKWGAGKGKKVLPILPEQAEKFSSPGEDCPDGGIMLQQDCLAKLRDLYEIYKALPHDLTLQCALPKSDDVVLTRKVLLGLQEGNNKQNTCFTVGHSQHWEQEVNKKVEQRMEQQGRPKSEKEQYQRSLLASDKNGQKVNVVHGAKIDEKLFPLHFREPPVRKDKQVIMIYCARAKPEIERKGIELTRGLDPYLWASLRPRAIRKAAAAGGPRRTFKGKSSESSPLLGNGHADDLSERSWSSVSGSGNTDCLVLEEAKRCVEGVVERQHRTFIAGHDSIGDDDRKDDYHGTLKETLTKAYLKYRTVDSDWEMARFCYGEVVGLERDIDGDEVVILDNPSNALMELISDLPVQGSAATGSSGRLGMGLVAIEHSTNSGGFLGSSSKTVHSTKPSLEFLFTTGDQHQASGGDFQREFRKKLQLAVADPSQDVGTLTIREKKRDKHSLSMEVTGSGKLIELLRESNLRDIHVLNYQGRISDSHPHVVVKKELLMPYAGVRGRSGGLNFIVDLLQFREGFIGTGAEGDPTAERMLLGVFDSRHQPHPDFWRKCLPKFMSNSDGGYTYKVNDEIALVQAPDSFGETHENEQLTGVSLSLLNLIRNRCGGVTSCGTNAVWQISARDFSRQDDNAVRNEYFNSRTLIDDTATSHLAFSKGKRSVYVQETVSTGITQGHTEYLNEMKRRVEGAVQLFWVELFQDRSVSLVILGAFVLLSFGLILFCLKAGWFQNMMGYNLFCSAPGQPTLSGADLLVCSWAKSVLSFQMDRTMWSNKEYDYSMLIDCSLTWLLVCVVIAVAAIILAWRGIMPAIVRTFVRMEDISYWLTSFNIFYWLGLVFFMLIGMEPPLMFDPASFMAFMLAINTTQHVMLSTYKNMAECSEISVWRSQQAHTLVAPLYVSAVAAGIKSAYGIIWRNRDASFYVTTKESTTELVRVLTVWVTAIWFAFFACVVLTMYKDASQWLQWIFNYGTAEPLQNTRLYSSVLLLNLIAITVWDSFLSLWEADKGVDSLSKSEKRGAWVQNVASLVIWWRSKAWILRYAIDFVLPIYVLLGGPGGSSLVTVVAYAATVHGLRI